MPGVVAHRRLCCGKFSFPWELAEVADDTVAAWKRWKPPMRDIKASLRSIVIDLRGFSGYSIEPRDPELSGELQPELDDDDHIEAPRMRAVLHQVGVPRPLATKLEELLSTLSMGHVFFPSLGNLISGYEMGMLSLAAMQLTSPALIGAGWDVLSTWDVGIIISSKFYGSFCGSLVAFDQCSDLSSRDILAMSACGLAVVSVASALAPAPKYLILARVLSGFLEGVSSPARIAYTTEVADANLRFATMGVRTGTFGAGAVLGALTGAIFLAVPGGWHIMLGAAAMPAVAMCVGMRTLPHSPRWLLGRTGPMPMAERRAHALLALTELRSSSRSARISQEDFEIQVQTELDAMCSIEPQKEENSEEEDVVKTLNTFASNPASALELKSLEILS